MGLYTPPSPVQYVGIQHRRTHVPMPKPFLNRPDIIAIFPQMRGEGVLQGVAAHQLGQARLASASLRAHCSTDSSTRCPRRCPDRGFTLPLDAEKPTANPTLAWCRGHLARPTASSRRRPGTGHLGSERVSHRAPGSGSMHSRARRPPTPTGTAQSRSG